MASNHPIELERLHSFTNGDAQLERELTSLYLATVEVYLEQMRGALTGNGGWSAAAHALKGASANIGATLVAGLAADAEKGCASPERLSRLETAVDTVRTFVRQREQS